MTAMDKVSHVLELLRGLPAACVLAIVALVLVAWASSSALSGAHGDDRRVY
jgi:hypothetical protein